MCEPRIRPLDAGDLDDAVALSSTAGWNQQIEDWRLLLALAPAGSFAAVSQGRIVGTALALDYILRPSLDASGAVSPHQGFAWIAMMLVDPAWRGRGVGRRLLDAAIASVRADLPIRLDATPMGRPMYAAHGFEDETRLTRYIAEASTAVAADTGGHSRADAVRPLVERDLPDVSASDRDTFGGDRAPALQSIHERAPQYAHIAHGGSGVPQYCFGRPGRLVDQIGPVIADDEEAARALVTAALGSRAGRPLQLDIFDDCTGFAAWLHGRGFRAHRPLFRMRRPAAGTRAAPHPSWRSPREVAILGPEFG
jgi:GNAT superfamily N-acetyltransferase